MDVKEIIHDIDYIRSRPHQFPDEVITRHRLKEWRDALAALMAEVEKPEVCFKEGIRAAEVAEAETGEVVGCGYVPGSPEHHWWTRGYSYQFRLLETHRAEIEIQRLEAELAARGSRERI